MKGNGDDMYFTTDVKQAYSGSIYGLNWMRKVYDHGTARLLFCNKHSLQVHIRFICLKFPYCNGFLAL